MKKLSLTIAAALLIGGISFGQKATKATRHDQGPPIAKSAVPTPNHWKSNTKINGVPKGLQTMWIQKRIIK